MMRIWLSNSRSCLTFERGFFAIICDNLAARRGLARVNERFRSLSALASLPGVDQPLHLEATRLIFEVHEAWDALYNLRAHEIVVDSAMDSASRRAILSAFDPGCARAAPILGRYLARPLHELVMLAASARDDVPVRAGTHRELIEGSLQSWRIIQGGLSRRVPAGLGPTGKQ
jgi:hypothetical protein